MRKAGGLLAHFDPVWLGSWIQPHHLRAESLARYRSAFESDPARLIVLPSFLRAELADRVSAFASEEAEYRPVYGLYSRDLDEVPEREWQNAAPDDRFCRFRVLAGVLPRFRVSANALAYLKLRRAWRDPRFTAFFETLSGAPLGASEFHIHAMEVGDYLRPHRDAVENRRLAYVLFLTRDWPASFGGALTLVTAGGRACAVQPAFNSLVVLDVRADTEHFVSAIEPAARERLRITIGGWIDDTERAPC